MRIGTRTGEASRARPWRNAVVLALVAGVLAAAIAGVAVATPPSGVLEAPVLARSSLADPYGEKMKMVLGLVNSGLFRSSDVVVQRIRIAPGGEFGWHTHPGPVVVVVTSGALTFYGARDQECRPVVYRAGQAFVDPGVGHVHNARNEGTDTLEFWATYFVPGEPGSAFRLDEPRPAHVSCPF